MSVSKLCEELVNAGENVEVLTTTANGNNELTVSPNQLNLVDGVPVIYFKRLTKDHSHFSPPLLNHLFKILNRKSVIDSIDKSSQYSILNTQYPIIHIHAWWNLVSILSCLIAVLKGNKTVLSPRGTLSNYSFGNRKGMLKRVFHNFFGKFLLERCHFHVTSEREKQAMLSLCTPKSITVIANFVRFPAEILPRSSKEDFSTLKLIFMSRVEQKKGLEVFFEALAESSTPCSLTIAGTGDENYIQQLKGICNDLNISHRITWMGHVNDEEKFTTLSEHDLLVLPSHDENFANVVIESLSVGTAVLISENVGLADYVIKNELGWACINQSAAYKNQLNFCYQNKLILQSIRKNAPIQIRKDFQDKVLVEKYLEMYNTILASN